PHKDSNSVVSKIAFMRSPPLAGRVTLIPLRSSVNELHLDYYRTLYEQLTYWQASSWGQNAFEQVLILVYTSSHSVGESLATNAQSRPVLRFGNFEVHLHSGELRKHGRPVKLQEQPFQIL